MSRTVLEQYFRSIAVLCVCVLRAEFLIHNHALTHYHTFPSFDTSETSSNIKKTGEKKGEIACDMRFLLFSLFSIGYGIYF